MLPDLTLPVSLLAVLRPLSCCFTAPTFGTFCVMLGGLVSQPGRATVCGMLSAAGLAGVWHHSRAHWFFASARWCPDRLGLAVADLAVRLFLAADEPLMLVVDDTLFKRSGRKVYAAAWCHDASAKAPRGIKRLAWGNCWVVVGLIVRPPMLSRPVCLPVAARLWRPHTPGRGCDGKRTRPAPDGSRATKPALARQLIELVAARWPNRELHVVCDNGYATAGWKKLPAHVTVTTRPRSNAALNAIAQRVPGRVGRPRIRGAGLTLATITETAEWTTTTLTRYGRTDTVRLTERRCLWYRVFGLQPVRVILLTEPNGTRLALISTDMTSPATLLVERYAARWSIEVAFADAKGHVGVGQAHNRTPRAVQRTVPFGLAVTSLVIIWYVTAGHDPADIIDRRRRAPWYRTKTEPSYLDMIVKLRRAIIATRFMPEHPHQPKPEETRAFQLALAAAAA